VLRPFFYYSVVAVRVPPLQADVAAKEGAALSR
jgi:hypothetical protein